MDGNVELIDYVGKKPAPFDDPMNRDFIEVHLNQWHVKLNGDRVALLSKDKNGLLCFLRHYDQQLRVYVETEVARILGVDGVRSSSPADPALVIAARKQRDAEYEEDEDDDDDTDTE